MSTRSRSIHEYVDAKPSGNTIRGRRREWMEHHACARDWMWIRGSRSKSCGLRAMIDPDPSKPQDVAREHTPQDNRAHRVVRDVSPSATSDATTELTQDSSARRSHSPLVELSRCLVRTAVTLLVSPSPARSPITKSANFIVDLRTQREGPWSL